MGGEHSTKFTPEFNPAHRFPKLVLLLVIVFVIDRTRTRNLELIAPDAEPTTEPKGHINQEKNIMAKVLKVIELLAQSDKSWEDAAQSAVKEASKTLRGVRSIYIKNFEASVENGKVMQYRVNAKVSFDLDAARADKGRRPKK